MLNPSLKISDKIPINETLFWIINSLELLIWNLVVNDETILSCYR